MTRLINKKPSRALAFFLGVIPFLILICLYQWASIERKKENEQDKLLPSFNEIYTALDRAAFTPSKRSGELIFWKDTGSSLQRLLTGVVIAAFIGLSFGLFSGAFPLVGANMNPLVTAISLIPPMAILPILFIVFGLGELSKIVLIVVGVAPCIARDLTQRTRELPQEQIVKALTLGAHSGHIVMRVLLPQVVPRLIDAVRLSLGTAWLFLIAAEAIAATDGLGYRIFLVRRYMSMDTILPYVVWIAALAYALDWSLLRLSKFAFPWYHSR